MTRYNPNNKSHRKKLAAGIKKMLLASGFSAATPSKGEEVYERPIDGFEARVRVLTSIVNGEMRQKDKDAIRVCATIDLEGETLGLVKSTRVNRTGDMEGITSRLITAMRKTYSVGRKRAKDPSFLKKEKKPTSKAASAAKLNQALQAKAERKTLRIGDLVRQSSDSVVWASGENFIGIVTGEAAEGCVNVYIPSRNLTTSPINADHFERVV